MGITFTLPVPLKSQLNEPTSDGKPAENDHYDCVATSLADGLQYLLKRSFNGDELKDSVYGQGYTGGMAAVRYVDYCARLGIALEAINGSQDQLLAALHREIHAGHPCLVTMPSQWGSAPSQPGWDPRNPNGWTHVGLASGDGPDMIRVMNPWGGFWHDGTTDYWRVRLCYGQIWRVALKGATGMGIPAGWTDDGATLKAPNGQGVVRGFRTYIMGQNWDAHEQPHAPERAVGSVMEQDGRWGNGALQDFATIRLFAAESPNPVVTGGVQKQWVISQVPLLNELTTVTHQRDDAHTQLATANAQVATLKAQADVLNQQIADLQAQLAQQHADPLAQAALDLVRRQKALFAQV